MTIDCESSVVDGGEMSGTALGRVVKRKVAVLCGFNGSKYQGMQMNHNARTIEGELFSAMCRTGLVSPTNAVDPKKVSWMRACRTDKGVHAAGQVVSLKMEIMDRMEVLRDKLNDVLPRDIRVFGILEAAGSFHSKERCDSRVYEYVMPTYVFALVNRDAFFAFSDKKKHDNQSLVDDAQIILIHDQREPSTLRRVGKRKKRKWKGEQGIRMYTEFIPTEQEEADIRAFRLTKEQLERIEVLLSAIVALTHFTIYPSQDHQGSLGSEIHPEHPHLQSLLSRIPLFSINRMGPNGWRSRFMAIVSCCIKYAR